MIVAGGLLLVATALLVIGLLQPGTAWLLASIGVVVLVPVPVTVVVLRAQRGEPAAASRAARRAARSSG